MKKFKAAISILLTAIMLFTACYVANAETVISETESNDDYASANVVSVNAKINGVLSVWDDCDYYKVTADEQGKLELTFKHTSVDKDNGWAVRTFYFDGNEYVELSYTEIRLLGSETVNLPTVGMISGGEYYIVVSDWWGDYSVGTEYTIENKFTATECYEKETNDSWSTSTKTELNQTYGGTINRGNDSDYYKVVAEENGKLELTFKHTSVDEDNGWHVRTYYYDGNEYVELSYTAIRLLGSETVKLPTVGMISGGEYYIVVNDWWGDCSVGTEYTIENKFTSTEYYEKETNDSWSTSTKTELNQTYGGTINRENDYDYYKIVAEENGKLEFTFKHTSADKDNGWHIRTYYYNGDKYEELSYTEIELLGDEIIELPTVGMISGGKYYIVVSDWWNGHSIGYDYVIENKFIPDGYIEEPTTEPAQPTEPTTEPTAKPTEPTTEPSTVKPTEPITKPTEPTPQPTTKPTEPTTEPAQPTTKPTEPTTQPTTKPVTTLLAAVVKVKTPSQSTVSYGDSIILHAEVKNLPDGAEIVWSANNANFKIVSTSADGMSCTVTPVSSGDTVFTATVVDKDGKEIANDEQIMNSKAGIWQKIIAFFKNLFGLTKVIPEFIKF